MAFAATYVASHVWAVRYFVPSLHFINKIMRQFQKNWNAHVQTMSHLPRRNLYKLPL